MYDASVSLYSPVTGSPPRSVDLRASDPSSPRPALETLDPAGTSNRSETAPDPDIVVVGAVPPPAVPDVAVVDSVPPLAVRVQLFADRRNVVADMEDERRALQQEIHEMCRRNEEAERRKRQKQSSGKAKAKRRRNDENDDSPRKPHRK